MRQTLRLPFFFVLFTFIFVTWADEHSRGGILFSDWELRQITKPYRAVAPYTVASLTMEPVPVDTSTSPYEDLPDVEGSSNSADDSDDEPASPVTPAAAPPVAVEDMCVAMVSAAQRNDLPVGFFARLIWQESKFGQWVVSKAGAQGVAQFMPKTAEWIGLPDPFDPISALPASARFLQMLVDQFGNLGLAAAAYNAGPGRIQNWLAGRSSLPEETRNYVRIITGHEAEKWKEPRRIEVSYHLPPRAPCSGLAGLSHQANPKAVEVAVEPAILKLIQAARVAAAEKAKKAAKIAARAAKAALGKKLARKKGENTKLAAGSKGKKAEAKKKTASGKPLNIAAN